MCQFSCFSAEMLVNLQVPWVLLGHSERRALLGESSDVSTFLSLSCCWFILADDLVWFISSIDNSHSCVILLDAWKNLLSYIHSCVIMLDAWKKLSWKLMELFEIICAFHATFDSLFNSWDQFTIISAFRFKNLWPLLTGTRCSLGDTMAVVRLRWFKIGFIILWPE